MHAFTRRDGILHAEDVPLPRIAEVVGTPVYVYSHAALTGRYRAFAAALSGLPATICYALKANSNQAVIRSLAVLGAGADVVSEGELRRALAARVPPSRIVFAGVGKTAAEMRSALAVGITQFNVESVPELEALSAAAVAVGRRAPVALRINPDVDAGTHAKITTGRKENKFGIAFAEVPAAYARAASLPGIDVVGVAVHIGSQLTELAPFEAAFRRVAEMVGVLRDRGHHIRHLDLGGGLGIAYRGETLPGPEAYAAMVRRTVGSLECELMFEPGRYLVGDAGVMVTRVIYVKRSAERSFLIVDAAMNDLVRPAMYDAYHPIEAVQVQPEGLEPVDVVGPVCESSDIFAAQRMLPPLAAGDLLSIGAAGAYGAVMASTYNSRPLIPEVMVKGAELAVIRPRQSVEDLIALDRLPAWLPASDTRSG